MHWTVKLHLTLFAKRPHKGKIEDKQHCWRMCKEDIGSEILHLRKASVKSAALFYWINTEAERDEPGRNRDWERKAWKQWGECLNGSDNGKIHPWPQWWILLWIKKMQYIVPFGKRATVQRPFIITQSFTSLLSLVFFFALECVFFLTFNGSLQVLSCIIYNMNETDRNTYNIGLLYNCYLFTAVM